MSMFYRFAKIVVTVIFWFRYKIIVSFEQEIDDNKGYIVTANHQSNLDPIILGIAFHRQINYMAKEELFKNKLFSAILRKVGAFKVTRGAGDTSAIDTAIHVVESKKVLGIFPEGTRSKDGTLKRAKSGAVVVASKSGGDIIPVGIVYGKRRFIRKTVTVKFGKIIPNEMVVLTDHNKAELKIASAVIMDNIALLIGGQTNA